MQCPYHTECTAIQHCSGIFWSILSVHKKMADLIVNIVVMQKRSVDGQFPLKFVIWFTHGWINVRTDRSGVSEIVFDGKALATWCCLLCRLAISTQSSGHAIVSLSHEGMARLNLTAIYMLSLKSSGKLLKGKIHGSIAINTSSNQSNQCGRATTLWSSARLRERTVGPDAKSKLKQEWQ